MIPQFTPMETHEIAIETLRDLLLLHIEGMSGEANRAAMDEADIRLHQVAMDILEKGNGQLRLVSAWGYGSSKYGPGRKMQVEVTITVDDLEPLKPSSE